MEFDWQTIIRNFCTAVTLAILLVGLGRPALAQRIKATVGGAASPGIEKIHDFTHKATELAMTAMTLIGSEYKYGGNTPETGIDCSGLVRYVFQEAWGKTLPRTALEQSRVGENVESDDLQPGDLVFYNTQRRKYSHVGIYLGDNKFIHAPSAGKRVRIDSMDLDYWRSRYDGARRISSTQDTTRREKTSYEKEKERILRLFQEDIEEYQ